MRSTYMKAKAFFFLVAKLALFRDSWQGEILSAKINVSEPCPNHDFSSWESPGSSGSYGVVSLMVKSGGAPSGREFSWWLWKLWPSLCCTWSDALLTRRTLKSVLLAARISHYWDLVTIWSGIFCLFLQYVQNHGLILFDLSVLLLFLI